MEKRVHLHARPSIVIADVEIRSDRFLNKVFHSINKVMESIFIKNKLQSTTEKQPLIIRYINKLQVKTKPVGYSDSFH